MVSLRKLVHIGGVLFVPLALYNGYLALGMAVLGIFTFFGLELVKRRLDPKFLELFYRNGEMTSTALEPLSYLLAIAALLAVSLVFVPAACYVAIIVLTLGDGSATIAGKTIGGPKLPACGKTWAGFLTGVTLAAVAGYFVAGPVVALAGAVGGMVAEACSSKGDNVSTVGVAFACAVLASLAGF